MPVSHFSTNLEKSLSCFRKHHHHQMDPTRNPKFQPRHRRSDAVSEHDYSRSDGDYYYYYYYDQDSRFPAPHDVVRLEMRDAHPHRHPITTFQQYPSSSHPLDPNPYNQYYYNQSYDVAALPGQYQNNKEPMFEKLLTPSDVGKLNRLVIPKQHAEKYFPLNGNCVNNEQSSSPGTLLSFEDESGKSWRFRYSYWNSSQSYVLTKGWNRYVKEKRLDAGDVVFFERHVTQTDRLFIGWRRRLGGGSHAVAAHDSRAGCYGAQLVGGYAQDSSSQGVGFSLLPNQPDCFHAGTAVQGQKTPPGDDSNNDDNPKRMLRLFGVNMECRPDPHQTTSSEKNQQLQVLSSSYHNYFDYANNYHHHRHQGQQDINSPQVVNQMGNRLG